MNSNLSELFTYINGLTCYVLERRSCEAPLADGLDHKSVAALFAEDLPQEGMPAESVVRLIEEKVIPATLNLFNPLTFGLMTPPPLPLPAALDALISALNQNLGCAWRTSPGGIHLELQTVRWLCQICGLPASAAGHLTNGGTVSNLTAMRLALHRAFPDARGAGLRTIKSQPVIYVSDQGHFSIDRAAGILGIGENHIRKIASTRQLKMDLDQLKAQIRQDRKTGFVPIAVVGTAGTTANGSIDPLESLAEICQSERLWFHVDAAYGAALALSGRLRSHLAGLENADSITLDPHKWMFVPFSLGALLARDPHLLRGAFGQDTAYLGRDHTGEADSAPPGFYESSLDASRRFNGLKLWAESASPVWSRPR